MNQLKAPGAGRLLRQALLLCTALVVAAACQTPQHAPASEAVTPTPLAPLRDAPDQEPAEQEPPPVYYAAHLVAGPSHVTGQPPDAQEGIELHLDHMIRHFESGEILMVGPFLDDSGGLVILQCRGIDEARRVVEADPWVQAGVLEVEWVKPWMVALR